MTLLVCPWKGPDIEFTAPEKGKAEFAADCEMNGR